MIRAVLAAPGLAARRSAALSALGASVPSLQLALPALSGGLSTRSSVASSAQLKPSSLAWTATATSTHSRALHTSANPESAALVLGLTVAGAAVAGIYGIKAYEKYKAAAATAEKEPGAEGEEAGDASAAGDAKDASDAKSGSSEADKSTAGSAKTEQATKEGEKPAAKPASSSGGIFGAQAFAKRFYRGPFEDKMTRREAALILGVRESADPSRIRDRHRKMLMLNHPDTGGSTFIASKINEAKDVLIKGKAAS